MRNWIQYLSPLLLENKVKIYVLLREDYKGSEYSKDIELIDISKYGAREIANLIRKICPDLFLIFGFRSFFELLLIRICKYLNIRVTYIQHGMIALKYSTFSSRISSINFYTAIKNYMH